jgi:predicted nucleotidyltransferase
MIEEYQNKLSYIIKGLSKLSFVSAIILFGSQINGNATKISDIDIAVITKNINEKQESKILGFSNEKFDISIFNKLPLVIQFRIIKNGKILYCKDKKLLHEITYNTIRKYLDFSIFINNFYKRVIKNV